MTSDTNRGGDAAGSSGAPRAARGGRWFALALAFFVLNAYAVWQLTRHGSAHRTASGAVVTQFMPGEDGTVQGQDPLVWTFSQPIAPGADPAGQIDPAISGRFVWATPTELRFEPAEAWRPCRLYRATLSEQLSAATGGALSGTREFHVHTPPLTLLSVEQANIDADRRVTLRLVFNATPARDELSKYLELSEEDDPRVTYDLVGRAGESNVLIVTESVRHDQLELGLRAGLPSTDGPLGTAESVRCSVPVVSEFTFMELTPRTPPFEACELQAIFSSKPDAAGAAPLLAVEPPVKFTIEPLDNWWRTGLRLVGDFAPGAVYTVTFKAGLASENGVALAEDVIRHVQFPDRSPSVAFATAGRYLSPRGRLLVPVAAVNVEQCVLSLAPVYANNLVTLALRDASPYGYRYGGGLEDNLIGRARTVTNAIAGKPNREARTYADLRQLADGEPRGVYWLTAGAEHAGAESRLVVVTDLGIAARVGRDGVRVWVNSLRDAAAAPAAEVTLYAENNQMLARGTTDAAGLAFLPCALDDAESPPLLVTARLGEDLTYLDLQQRQVTPAGEIGGGAYLRAGAVEAAVFTERGVYRPGETAHMQALVRDATLAAPQPFPALFRVRKPDGRVFKDVPVMLDAYGAAEASVPMPEYLPTGRYSFELALPGTFTVLGQTAVSLEDFVPPQIRVDIDAPAARQRAGDDIAFSVRGEHLFGRPAGGLKAAGHISFKAAPFQPARWAGWSFGDAEKPFTTIYRQLGEKRLDDEGRATFSGETSDAWRPPAALQAVEQVTVTESSGRAVTAYGSTPVDVYPFYIGLRPASEAGTVRVGETQKVAVVRVTPDGAAAPDGVALQVKLARVQWSSGLRRNSSGAYEWKSERSLTVVHEREFTAGGEARDLDVAVDSAGEYVLTLADPATGASSSYTFYAASADQTWVEWSREKPDAVELTLDRESYRPGDTARLLIKAPFAGTALLTVESDRVLTQRVIALEKNTAEVEIPVQADYVPNVYAGVTVLRPAVAESFWSAHRAAGAVALRVQPAACRLALELDAPATNRPQTALRVAITVRDEAGGPAHGNVTVMAVDEAICMLTAFATPNPLAQLLAQRGLAVDQFDVYGELMPVIDESVDAASAPGGDRGSALRRRLNPIKANRFKPLALWHAAAPLDSNGVAEVSFDLPEFSGELRLMAVAYNATQAGSADASIKVRRPLVVQPSLPRFLAPGDVGEATVDLYNESGRDLATTLRLICQGPLAAGPASQEIALAAGAARTARLPLTAGALPGVATCTVECVAEGVEPYRETIELAVRPAQGLDVASVSGLLKAGEKAGIEPPAEWVPGSVAQDLWVSREPALRLGRALEYVMRYPYGCLEQTVSGAFPLLYAADLANRALPGAAGHEDAAAFIRAAVLRTLSMQLGDGSFAAWPARGDGYDEGTLYATYFLVETRAASYAVPEDRLDAALKWLRGRLDRDTVTDAEPDNDDWQNDMQERAYVCHVLALAGHPDHGWNARLREASPALRFASRVHAASALLYAGEPRQATELLSQLGLPERYPRETSGMLNSAVRDAALLLSAWLDIDPAQEAVPRLVAFLDAAMQRDHWGSTQDDAMALLALGKYAQRVPADDRPFTGTARLPGGATRALSSADEPLHWSVPPGGAGQITLANDGPGPLFYHARSEGVPAAPVPEIDNGISVRRAFFDADGHALDPARLVQGQLLVVKLTVDPLERVLDNLVVEELIPAGWEIENPALGTSKQIEWISEKSGWCEHRDVRDDRLLLFTGEVSGSCAYYYAARAVTPGRFVYPAVTAACMYDPELRSVNGRMTVEVTAE